MNSWVCASTPDGDPDAAPAAAQLALAARSASRAISSKESTTIAADAGVEARVELGDGLVVAVQRDPLGWEAGAQGDGELAAGADVEAEPLLLRPSGPRDGDRNALPA